MSDRTCTAPGCDRKVEARGLCPAHYQRFRKTGSIESAKFGVTHRDQVVPTYTVWHRKIALNQGKASEYTCVNCGNIARQWAYDHECTDEKQSEFGPYCLHAEHYSPRCFKCHAVHDERHMTDQDGERNRAAKLTENDVREIRRLYAEGMVHKTIAEKFGINPTNVGLIVRRKTWRHVT